MRNSLLLLLVIVLVVGSCASIHKTSRSAVIQKSNVDTSIRLQKYAEETTVIERGFQPITTKPDTASFAGYMSVDNVAGFSQTVETNGQKVETTVKPRKDAGGHTTGYDVDTKAISKSQLVQAAVDKTTTTHSTSVDKDKKGSTDFQSSSITTSANNTVRFNMAGAATVICCIVGLAVVIALFIYFSGKIRNSKPS